MINTINATVLFVKEFEACVKFYRDTLCLKIKGSDQGYISFDLGGHELALMDLPTASAMIGQELLTSNQNGIHNVLLATFVEDTDQTYELLRSQGVEFIKGPTTQPWGQRTAYFKDPDRNTWEISHFLQTEEQ